VQPSFLYEAINALVISNSLQLRIFWITHWQYISNNANNLQRGWQMCWKWPFVEQITTTGVAKRCKEAIPPKFLAYLDVLCLRGGFPNKIQLLAWSQSISPHKILGWLRHWARLGWRAYEYSYGQLYPFSAIIFSWKASSRKTDSLKSTTRQYLSRLFSLVVVRQGAALKS